MINAICKTIRVYITVCSRIMNFSGLWIKKYRIIIYILILKIQLCIWTIIPLILLMCDKEVIEV